MIDFPSNTSAIQSGLEFLRQNRFIDRAARVLFVDFNVFNPATRTHVASRFLFEFGPGLIQTPRLFCFSATVTLTA